MLIRIESKNMWTRIIIVKQLSLLLICYTKLSPGISVIANLYLNLFWGEIRKPIRPHHI
nr:MAG TPA: hypothetical protein [Caudoviricetes sp.]